MNRILIFLLLFTLVVSCGDIDKPKKPKNLISKNKMVDIIIDINLINAAKGVNKKILEKNNLNPEAYIYEKYQIDSILFAESVNYYAYDIKTYESIYDEAQKVLEAQKKEWEDIEEAEKKKQDSIKTTNKKTKNITKKSKAILDSLEKIEPSVE